MMCRAYNNKGHELHEFNETKSADSCHSCNSWPYPYSVISIP
jgi:hypothetical protein